MRVIAHPPLEVASDRPDSGSPGSLTRRLHASLWIVADLGDWKISRSGHVHLVRAEDDGPWREVDLARNPLCPRPDVVQPQVEDLLALLEAGLRAWDLRFYRIPELGLVSELGEGREEFRRRAMGLIRPELQSRIDGFGDDDRAARAELAAGLSRLVGGIEERAVAEVESAVRRVELGLLLVPDGVRLQPPRHRDRMISSGATGSS